MSIERQVQETIAQCVGIGVFYHNLGGLTTKTRAMMLAEFRTVAAKVKELGLGPKATGERLLGPVEAELIARYGIEVGRKINAEFLRAFEEVIVPVSCPTSP